MAWIPLKDSTPEHDIEVLVCIQKFGYKYPYARVGWVDSEDKQWYIYCERGEVRFIDTTAHYADHCEITHWQPIEEYPKQDT